MIFRVSIQKGRVLHSSICWHFGYQGYPNPYWYYGYLFKEKGRKQIMKYPIQYLLDSETCWYFEYQGYPKPHIDIQDINLKWEAEETPYDVFPVPDSSAHHILSQSHIMSSLQYRPGPVLLEEKLLYLTCFVTHLLTDSPTHSLTHWITHSVTLFF